jgi:hypothetical protein
MIAITTSNSTSVNARDRRQPAKYRFTDPPLTSEEEVVAPPIADETCGGIQSTTGQLPPHLLITQSASTVNKNRIREHAAADENVIATQPFDKSLARLSVDGDDSGEIRRQKANPISSLKGSWPCTTVTAPRLKPIVRSKLQMLFRR